MTSLNIAFGAEICRKNITKQEKVICVYMCNSLFMDRQSPVGQSLLINEDSKSHSDTPHSVGLLWTSDQTNVETST